MSRKLALPPPRAWARGPRVLGPHERPPAALSLYDECAALAVARDAEDPLSSVRAKLRCAGDLLAPLRNEDPRAWSVYVERHVVGLRFILRDAAGCEVDLQRVFIDPGKETE